MDNPLPVLIVGAGPTGLMMACELARHGVPFRLIDKKPKRDTASNATWIQTLTLEIFQHLGLAQTFLKMGHTCNGINLHTGADSLATISLAEVDSIFPFILLLAQNTTEDLLSQHLKTFNQTIERGLELIEVKQDTHTVTATIKHSDGSIESVNSLWLIACDGANSTIRKQCQLFFPGEDFSEQFIVADAEIDSYMPKNEIHYFLDQATVFIALPLGGNHYRVIANLHLDHKRKIFTEREVIELAQERAHGAYYVNKVSWVSSFWIHSKLVKQMREGNIFFAGDAAHVHSPAGGHGMNSGLQDAYNLAWKLALVFQGKAKPNLLESYHAERHPVINEVVNQTEKLTKMLLFDDLFLSKLTEFSQNLSRQGKAGSKKIADQITQLAICYQNSKWINYDGSPSTASPQPGSHAPDVIIENGKHLYDYLRNTKHTILLFLGKDSTPDLHKTVCEWQKSLDPTYCQHLQFYIVAPEKVEATLPMIIDSKNAIHQRYQVNCPCFYVIRPDNYIAYFSTKFDSHLLEKWLGQYLLP